MVRMTRSIVTTVRWVMPWLLRGVVVAGQLALVACLYWFRGVQSGVMGVAHDYQMKAAQQGFPSELDGVLYWGVITLTVLEFVAGWVIAAHITVWLFWVIF